MPYFEDYYSKAKSLLQTSELEAYLLLLKCDKMCPNDLGVNNYLFYLEIMFGDYEKAVSRLDLLFSSNNDNYVRNLNLYLYLINKLYDLPEDYQQYASHLKIADVSLPNPYQTIKIDDQNRIRNLIMINSNANALTILKETIKKDQKCSLCNSILSNLLTRLLNQNLAEKQIIIAYINKKEYGKAIELLEKKKKRNDYTNVFNYYLKLLNILVSGEVPPVKKENSSISTMQNAFNNNDFRSLLKCQKKILKYTPHTCNNSIMYLLLRDVVALIDEQEKRTVKR